MAGWLAMSLACNLPVAAPVNINATPPAAVTILPYGGGMLATGAPPTAAPSDATPAMTVPDGMQRYTVQAGDTLPAVARRFGVQPGQVLAAQALAPDGLLPIGTELYVPVVTGPVTAMTGLLPDGEVIDSPLSAGFNVPEYILSAGGFLGEYEELLREEWRPGTVIVERLGRETAINPRLLLAVLEYRAGWVLGHPANPNGRWPIGFRQDSHQGLTAELSLVARALTSGYYGWREGILTELQFKDGRRLRIDPRSNAGSVAVQWLFAQLYSFEEWQAALYGEASFPALYARMFGDPWARAAKMGPLFPAELQQPELELPFEPGVLWSFSGGPHSSWGVGAPLGALDFAPGSSESGCVASNAWVTASAPGVVVRAADGVVAVDLDEDGTEQTGWVLVYLHVGEQGRVEAGKRVQVGERLGHPSCEGGVATGTHVHFTRKYNGEWLPAVAPFPLRLSGWEAHLGEKTYQGTLVRDGQVVTALPNGTRPSHIQR